MGESGGRESREPVRMERCLSTCAAVGHVSSRPGTSVDCTGRPTSTVLDYEQVAASGRDDGEMARVGREETRDCGRVRRPGGRCERSRAPSGVSGEGAQVGPAGVATSATNDGVHQR